MAKGGLLRLVLPPLLAFTLARLVLAAAALVAGVLPSVPGSWCRHDCGHYTTIALHGYTLGPCPGALPADSGALCGNTAWLPGYPLIVRAMHELGLRPRRAGVLVSAAFAFLALLLVWTALDGPLAEQPSPVGRGVAALALAALFPGSVYLHAISPLGVYAVAAVLALLLASRDRPLPAGLAGAAAAFTYPLGLLLSPVLGAGFLLGPGSAGARVRRAAASAGVAAGGFGAAMAVQHADTGRWWAFAIIQSHYSYAIRSPVLALDERIAALFCKPFEGASAAASAQTLLVALLVVAALASFFAAQPRVGARGRFVALYVVAAWLLPLVIGEMEGGLHRREAALLPLVLLTARLPAPVQGAFAVASGVVAYALALLFFGGRLV
ncbi:MAG TPA: hypothetical protein VMT70_13820 [Vicinamibacteria bacterium]|nr:hypothetical protein [Vicinamibacteria bacterium]